MNKLPSLFSAARLNKALTNNSVFDKNFRILEASFGQKKDDYNRYFILNISQNSMTQHNLYI